MQALLELLRSHKAGSGAGICSVCSSHPVVIEASLREAARTGDYALIEATSNQVNQFGGYTGMKPVDFRAYVEEIAELASLPKNRLLLGGDHLGPNCWRDQTAEVALERSERLVSDYVAAGFRKIHLDCSMSCADDPAVLTDGIIAARAARLCQASETAWRACGGEAPVYVVGTEVPTPGGAAENLQSLLVTTPAAVDATLAAHHSAFLEAGLTEAWTRVVALVVQPGVEFDHHKVIDYDPSKAQVLSRAIESKPGIVFEVHSTDYQTRAALTALVRDHFAILKVGPGVTFALRETLWALVDIERDMGVAPAQSLRDVVLDAMHRDPRYWKAYYHVPHSRHFDLQYSLSDRIRYYWNVPQVGASFDALLKNLRANPIPLTLLSQYLPRQYAAVREGALMNEPRALLLDGVAQILRDYAAACHPGTQV